MRLEPSSAYRRRVRNALVFAIVLHALLFVFFPPVAMTPASVQATPAPPDTIYFAPPNDYIPEDPPPEPPAPLPGPWAPDPEAPDAPQVPDPPATKPGPATMPGLWTGVEAGDPYRTHEREPEIVEWESPRYPSLAREAGIEGTVTVRALVDESGRVTEVKVVSSDVTPSMEQAALEAARHARFRPAIQQYVAVPAYVLIPYHFYLAR